MLNFSTKELDTLTKIINSRRDVRGNYFNDKKVSNKELKIILESALQAPSVGYSQPWRFKIVKNKSIKNRVFKQFDKSYKKALKI